MIVVFQVKTLQQATPYHYTPYPASLDRVLHAVTFKGITLFGKLTRKYSNPHHVQRPWTTIYRYSKFYYNIAKIATYS